MSEQALKTCPFCGDAFIEVAESAVPSIQGGQKRAAYCNGCFCEGPTADSDEQASERWNQRAQPADPARPLKQALRDLIRHVDGETCTHEDTYRGGAIWTICRQCDRKWADDRGGFVPHVDAPAVAAARAITAKDPS